MTTTHDISRREILKMGGSATLGASLSALSRPDNVQAKMMQSSNVYYVDDYITDFTSPTNVTDGIQEAVRLATKYDSDDSKNKTSVIKFSPRTYYVNDIISIQYGGTGTGFGYEPKKPFVILECENTIIEVASDFIRTRASPILHFVRTNSGGPSFTGIRGILTIQDNLKVTINDKTLWGWQARDQRNQQLYGIVCTNVMYSQFGTLNFHGMRVGLDLNSIETSHDSMSNRKITGVSYNKFEFGRVGNNKIGLRLRGASGWVNENLFIGGSWSNTANNSGEKTHYVYTDPRSTPPNPSILQRKRDNKFIGCSFEGVVETAIEFSDDSAGRNVFYGCRFELVHDNPIHKYTVNSGALGTQFTDCMFLSGSKVNLTMSDSTDLNYRHVFSGNGGSRAPLFEDVTGGKVYVPEIVQLAQ